MPNEAPTPALNNTQTTDAQAQRRALGGARLSRLTVACGAFVVLSFLALVAYSIWHLRNVALAEAERQVANLALVLSEQTVRAIQSVDQPLSATKERFQLATERQLADARAMHLQLRERVARAPQIEALFIADANGNALFHSRSYPVPKLSVRQRDFYRAQRDDPRTELYIGAPEPARSGDKRVLWMARRLSGPSGAFRGIVVAGIDSAYLEAIYRTIDLGEGAAVALYRSDATLLARFPVNGRAPARASPDAPSSDALRQPRVSRLLDPADGVRRIVGTQMLRDYPLAISVATAERTALGAWRQQAWLLGTGAAIVAALMAALFFVLAGQLKRREALLEQLAESELRFRSLAELSSDWYWEQDERFRYRALSAGVRKAGIDPERDVIGKARWEIAQLQAPEGGWDAHRADLVAHRAFHDLIVKLDSGEGGTRYLSISGRAVFDRDRRFRGYSGIGKDVTEKVLAQTRQNLEHAIARLLAASDSVATTLPRIIEAICQTLAWECGARWRLDAPTQRIVRAETWDNGRTAVCEFLARTADRAFPVDSTGIISAVWRDGASRWVEAVDAEPRYLRGPQAVDAGLRGAFLLPLVAAGRIIGVIEFLSARIPRPDLLLLESARAIGDQIGQFIERKHAEDALSAEKEYIGHVISSAPTVICCIAPDGTTKSVNQSIAFVAGYQPEEVIGKNWWRLLYPGEDYGQVERLLKAFEKGRVVNYEMVLTTKNGEKRAVSWSSANRFDAAGQLLEIIAIGADVTLRRRTEARQVMEHEVTRAIAEGHSTEETMPRIIETICKTLGWDCGANRYVDASGQWLLCGAAWHIDVAEIAHFIDAARAPVALNPHGLNARALSSKSPQWVRDLGAARRAVEAQQAGLHGAFAFPVLADGEAIGVLEFFSREIREPDADLLETALAIGSQIGQFIRRRRAEEAQVAADRKLRLVAENIPDVVYQFRLSADGKFSFPFVSERVRDLYGVSAADVMRDYRLAFEPVLPEYRNELLKSMLRSKKHRKSWSFEAPMRSPEGRLKWVRGQSAVSVHSDGSVTWDGVLSDITAQKQAELEIQRLNEGLEHRVAERTAELSAVNRELEAFAYSVSHDLRAPLRSIDGFSRIVMEQAAGRLDAEVTANLERVRAAGRRMEQLIDDLLILSRVTRGELRRVEVDLSAIADAISAELKRTQPRREVTFAISRNMNAHADPNLMRIVLDNLIGNAWKFTEKHTNARIELGVLAQQGKTVYYVRDDGAGFDMAHAGKLFGAFQRLHAPAEFDGTGIGLATVQRIIHRHGGRVWADAAPGRGATFFFTVS